MLKLNRINANGEECETLIDQTQIVGVSETKVAPTNLYDSYGNLVDTKENESIYIVYMTGGRQITISQNTYTKLEKKLQVETL